ncbi:MAG: adenosine kinase [Pseudomonadota bacterium]|nr:adenosine kinase [Pseudomonadota bacterium]
MTEKEFGLVGVGNALVDVLSCEDESVIAELAKMGLEKGVMNMVTKAQSEAVYDLMGATTEMSGGSGANSLACFASLGGKGAFIGKIADDQFGEIFKHDMEAQGIALSAAIDTDGDSTGHSHIIVTPDGERTMNTYLGCSTNFDEGDVDVDLIARSEITLLEGYLFDKPKAKAAFRVATQAAKDSGGKVALTLSDKGCVERHYEDFKKLADESVDILIGNESEIMALTLAETFEAAVKQVQEAGKTAILTKGSRGAVIVDQGKVYDIASVKPEKLEDTTGAGDAFAGAALYGLSKGMSPQDAGDLAAKVASFTISHVGARSPDTSFAEMFLK